MNPSSSVPSVVDSGVSVRPTRAAKRLLVDAIGHRSLLVTAECASSYMQLGLLLVLYIVRKLIRTGNKSWRKVTHGIVHEQQRAS